MNVFLRAATIYHPSSEFHLQQHNILIEQGKITYIGPDEKQADQTIVSDHLAVSVGWADMYAVTGEPGLEHKEDLQSLSLAAAAGGFTEVLCMPNVEPVVQTKGAINYIKNRSEQLPVTLHPTAAVTMEAEGKELTEMIDLKQAGAVAFTDGTHPIQGAEVMVRALQYLQLFDGLLLNRPENTKLTAYGQMHEGIASTRLGLKGIPALAEETIVARDLQLLAYTGGKLHFSLISTKNAIESIRKAKANGLQVTCDVASYQVAFTDETMLPFDTNYKVNPPFRGETDAEAIKQGLADGTIDAIVSGHQPHDTEAKKLEFDLAEFGIMNLETAFAVANTTMANVVPLETIVEKFTTAPRHILQLPQPKIAVGEMANLTIFDPTQTWTPEEKNFRSKGVNSPFFGQELTGKVIGIIHKGQVVLN
ncbi:dihydroorotase [Pontibacter sp. BT310]|uniref:Dihydroorotase n=1 Tax=Pontibacter populi TaxID=890055 RepID=A0ABS6XCQ1_9BACT|nr:MULTISPECIES: dihydroorotase [Pontibacter]MBJ6118880.1 dihydroorotase [Pontibacter sp. BT310]MBR0571308.1 dihydroorotase [Microvirga sp. STS03]MBW3365734.1 dihydroorotase [Pontibacter populi]